MNGRRLNARACAIKFRGTLFLRDIIYRAPGEGAILFFGCCVLRERAGERKCVSGAVDAALAVALRVDSSTCRQAALPGRARAPPAPGPPIRLSAAAQTAESEPERRCAKTQRSRLARCRLDVGCNIHCVRLLRRKGENRA